MEAMIRSTKLSEKGQLDPSYCYNAGVGIRRGISLLPWVQAAWYGQVTNREYIPYSGSRAEADLEARVLWHQAEGNLHLPTSQACFYMCFKVGGISPYISVIFFFRVNLKHLGSPILCTRKYVKDSPRLRNFKKKQLH